MPPPAKSSSSLMPKVAAGGRAPVAAEATLGADLRDGEVINSRYRVLRKLGSGGMGSVYLVTDSWRGDRQLALKRVRRDRMDTRTITILRNEFLALSPLSHPNLARVYDFEADLVTQDFFFTSEYVEGSQLLRAAREFRVGRRGDFLRLLEVVVQVLRALEFIHSRGLVHGDIKPENILISGTLCEQKGDRAGALVDPPRVRMIDFGLTKREKEFGGKRIVGTTYYIAPETILGSQIDRRTDLYSLGVVLYHLATRKLPFTGDSNLAVLRGHIEKTPTPPCLMEAAVPEPFSQMILRLMEKQPANRFGSALDLIRAINEAFATEFPLETPETRLAYIQSGGFIGREPEMADLVSLFDAVYRLERPGENEDDLPATLALPTALSVDRPPPPGRMVLIRGEAGVGKRRLLKEFRRYVQTRGIHYIEINCGSSGDGARRSFSELVHAQVGVLSVRSPEEAPDEARLEAFLSSIETAAASPLTLRPEVDRLAQKFLSLSRETALVLAFTDLQRADVVLLEFLRALVLRIAEGKTPEARLVVLGTVEDDDSDEALLRPFLAANNLRELVRELPLARFNPEDVGRLVTSMFGPGGEGEKGLPDRLIQVIYEESDGNPGVVEEILEFLVGNDRIKRGPSGWVCEEVVQREAIPGKVRRELRERIQRLDPAARRLASALALLGGSGELDVAARLAEIPAGGIIDAVLTLKRARIIREEAAEGGAIRYGFVHSSAMEILYQEVPEADRAAAHDRAGHLLEAHLRASGGKKDPRRLAFHFLRAGNAAAALRYGMDAAREYAALHHPRKAIEVYSEMRRFALSDDPAAAPQIDREIARLHFHIGEYRRSAEILQGLVGWKPGGIVEEPAGGLGESRRAVAFVELGESLCRLGNFRDGASCFQEAFKRLKGAGSTPELGNLLLGFAELYFRRGNLAESLRYCERVLSWGKGLQRLELEARLFLLLADNHFRLDNKEIAAKFCQKGLELLGGERSVEHMALTLRYLGKFYTYKGRFGKALKNLQHCALVNGKIGALDRQGECLREMGAIFLFLDNPQEALDHLARALAIFDRTENLSGTVEALILRGEAQRLLGRYEDAQKDVQRALQRNSSLGSVQQAAEGFLTLARIGIDHGQLQRAERYLSEAEQCKDGQLDDRVPLNVLVLRCGMELVRGNISEALDLAARGAIAAREIGNRLRTSPLLEVQARLYLLLGRVVEARRATAALSEIGQRYGLRVVEGRAALLEGMILHAEGKAEEAGASFETAMGVFREERSERDLAALYIEYGRMQLAEGCFEPAYILFEEGLYLAKKLGLMHARCRLFHLMGLLEAAVPEGVFAKAVGYFLSAERIAKSTPFPDLLWRIRRDLGKFYLDAGRVQNADRSTTAATEDRRAILEKIPEAFRDGYLGSAGSTDLDALVVEAKARAEVQVRREKVKYPVRDPEVDPYFGLVGRTLPMRELYRAMAALGPDEPWVWVWGPPGSGRRETAWAVHRQSVPDRERAWVIPAAGFLKSGLEEFLKDLETARGPAPGFYERGALAEKAGADPAALHFPGRFTLIIPDAHELPAEIQQALLDRVLLEKARPDGLRVVATLDRPLERFADVALAPAEERAEGGRVIPELLTQSFHSLRVPPLSERLDDVALLIERFLAVQPRDASRPAPHFTPEAVETLRRQPFPEHVRELRELCAKVGRFAASTGSIDVEALRTALTPTMRSNKRK